MAHKFGFIREEYENVVVEQQNEEIRKETQAMFSIPRLFF